MNTLIKAIHEYTSLMCNNNKEEKELSSYYIDNIHDETFRKNIVINFSKFLSSPSFAFYDKSIFNSISNIIDCMNNTFNEKHEIKINTDGKVYDDVININQYLELAKILHLTNLDNINLYDINERQSFIKDGKTGILVKSNDEIFIADLPLDINDPFQTKELNDALDTIKYNQAKSISEKLYSLMRELDYYEYMDYKELRDKEINQLASDIISENIKYINESLDEVNDLTNDSNAVNRAINIKKELNEFVNNISSFQKDEMTEDQEPEEDEGLEI